MDETPKRKSMKQYYTDYKNWEDFKAGMWNQSEDEDFHEHAATETLKHPRAAMERVINEWPETTRCNLTNLSCNRKSWLGQAACCIETGVPEYITRRVWNRLDKAIKDNANQIAKEIIESWEKSYLEEQS